MSARATLALVFSASLCACSSPPLAASPSATGVLQPFEAAQWLWVSSECVDGALDLARSGFERRLTSEVRGSSLRFSYDTTLAAPSCESTEVWSLTAAHGGEWSFSPEAVVSLPQGVSCGAAPAQGRGVLRVSGDTLEEIRFASGYCRGFDARFVYRRVPALPLDDERLVRRYIAHWNRRDADAVAALFADDGTLVEPLTRNDDGSPTRHQGREAVRSWLAGAFATTPWLGLELLELQRPVGSTQAGELVASWRYMDARLAQPVRGRSLFVVVGSEFYAAELQLLSDPIPR